MLDSSVLGGYLGGRSLVRILAALVCFGTALPVAMADENPKNVACTFQSGASQSYTNGTFESKPSTPLSFSIEDIDLEKQSASLKVAPDAKPGKLNVVRALNANHYLEVVNEGFLNITTVYDKDEATGKYPAVHSRHGGVLGSPVFGQYTGFCTEE